MSASSGQAILAVPIPPWLWLWVALFLASLPGRFRAAADQAQLLWQSERRLSEVGIGAFVEPGGWLKLGASFLPLVVELLPAAVLAAGLLYAAFPRHRAQDIERADGLRAPDPDHPSPALAELRAFLEQHAPGIEQRVNLGATQKVARVFARRPFRSVVGIYGGALRIWRRDRATGEAILLHELAHHRQGDAALLGAGEPLPWAVRTAPVLFLSFIVAPIIVLVLQQAAVHAQSMADLASMRQDLGDTLALSGLGQDGLAALPPEAGFWSWMGDSLANALRAFTPGLPLLVVEAAAWITAGFILPVAAIWCSELNADRLAELHRPGALARWLADLRPPRQPWHRRTLGMLAHPPLRLRTVLACHAADPRALALLLVLFPAAYLVRLAAMIVWGAGAQLTAGQGAAGLPGQIVAWSASYAGSVAPVFLACGVITLAWPELARLWERVLAGVDARLPRRDLPVYRRVGVGVAAVGLLGLLLVRG